MQLRGVGFAGPTGVVVGGATWDLATFSLAFHKRDRQAKELTLAFRRDAQNADPGMEVDLVFCGVRCCRVVERDAGGLLRLEAITFLRDASPEMADPCDRERPLLETAKALIDGARLATTAVGEGCHVACARAALDVLAFADALRCDVRRAKSGSLPDCDHGRGLRVYAKGDEKKTVLPSGSEVKGELLPGCGDAAGLGVRLCLRCGHCRVLEDAAPFDLRELNAAVAREEAACLKRKTCGRCGLEAHGDVLCGTCGSVCDQCAWQSCRNADDHAVENFTMAQFRMAATRSPRRRSSTDGARAKGERAKTPPPTKSPPQAAARALRRAKTGFDGPASADAPAGLDAPASSDAAAAAMAEFLLAAERSPGRRRSNNATILSRAKSTLGVKPNATPGSTQRQSRSLGDKPPGAAEP